MIRFTLGAGLLALAMPLAAQSPEEIAGAALAAAPVWDGHNDVPIQLRVRFGNVINQFDFADTRATGESHPQGRAMHTDLARLRQGRVGAQFWSVFVSPSLPEPEAVQATLEQIDVLRRLVDRYPGELALALTADEVEQAVAQGRIASLIGMEGGHSIGSSLAVLRQMHALGARYLGLTHTSHTPWADSASLPPEHDGLTAFGKDVVREMNRLGMLVDLSHVSEKVMHDALDVARAPVMFSHSGAKAVTGHVRNVPDDVLRRVRDNGGIVMAVAYPSYISEELRVWLADRAAMNARARELFQGDVAGERAYVARWEADNPAPLSTIAQLADHIDHIRAVAGIDHIGIGGDYDGMVTGPVGMEDVAGYPALFTELARRGYSQADLEKISWRNMLRMMRAVEAHAASRAGDLPIETRAGG